MVFSLCYRLLINIWTFLARVFVLLLGFTDGFGLLSLCISVFNDCMYFTFDYYIHLITYAFRFYRWLLLLFWILMRSISASPCINWESTRNIYLSFASSNVFVCLARWLRAKEHREMSTTCWGYRVIYVTCVCFSNDQHSCDSCPACIHKCYREILAKNAAK